MPAPEMEDLDPLVWTVPEVARMLRVSKDTVHSMVRSGEMPSIRCGQRRVLIPKVALARFVEDAAKAAT